MVKGCAGFTRTGEQYTPFLRCVDCSLMGNNDKCAKYRRCTRSRVIDAYNPAMWNWYVTDTEV